MKSHKAWWLCTAPHPSDQTLLCDEISVPVWPWATDLHSCVRTVYVTPQYTICQSCTVESKCWLDLLMGGRTSGKYCHDKVLRHSVGQRNVTVPILPQLGTDILTFVKKRKVTMQSFGTREHSPFGFLFLVEVCQILIWLAQLLLVNECQGDCMKLGTIFLKETDRPETQIAKYDQ